MKKLAVLMVLVSFNAFSDIDSCPPHQTLKNLSINFDIILTAKSDMDSVSIDRGNSASFSTDVGEAPRSITVKRGDKIITSFSEEKLETSGGDDDAEDEVESAMALKGKLLVNGETQDVGLYIDGRQSPTILDLESVVEDKFSISCQRKEDLVKQLSLEKKSSKSSEQ